MAKKNKAHDAPFHNAPAPDPYFAERHWQQQAVEDYRRDQLIFDEQEAFLRIATEFDELATLLHRHADAWQLGSREMIGSSSEAIREWHNRDRQFSFLVRKNFDAWIERLPSAEDLRSRALNARRLAFCLHDDLRSAIGDRPAVVAGDGSIITERELTSRGTGRPVELPKRRLAEFAKDGKQLAQIARAVESDDPEKAKQLFERLRSGKNRVAQKKVAVDPRRRKRGAKRTKRA